LEKAAVLHGGGTNHRIGLYDAIMVKDNHLVANPDPVDLTQRIGEVLAAHPGLKIEFEADRLDQVEVFLGLDGIAVILLDNMSNEQLREAVALRDRISPQTLLEASGGVNLQTIAGIAETGVDFISVGALTHSVRAIDLGLDLEAL
jgi:nicotinate-nucleotide pyrophosphorylase (carboxylating)